ncbi:MAG: hypothetical protein RQM90_00235 [Methanoculleus sp.]
MNGTIGMRALSALFAVLLVSVGVVPVVACEPGMPCGDARQDLQKTDLSGLEKYGCCFHFEPGRCAKTLGDPTFRRSEYDR